jgi:hypothetical protein
VVNCLHGLTSPSKPIMVNSPRVFSTLKIQLARLRVDAKLWLAKSSGNGDKVMIVSKLRITKLIEIAFDTL